jgi:hypothetical protein
MLDLQIKIAEYVDELYKLTNEIKYYNRLVEAGQNNETECLIELLIKYKESSAGAVAAFQEYFKAEQERNLPANLHYHSLYRKLTA